MATSVSDISNTSSAGLVAPYDIVTVVSQRALDNVFKKAFDDTLTLHKVGFEDPDGDANLDCELYFGAPKIVLQRGPMGEKKIVATLVINVNGAVFGATMPLSRFTVGLDIDVVAQPVQYTNLPANIQKDLRSVRTFTFSKALVPFADATFDRVRLELTTFYNVVQDKTRVQKLTGYLTKYLDLLHGHQDKFILNYFSSAPSFDAAVRVYALPSIAPTRETVLLNLPADKSDERPRPSEENSLLSFLQMTEGGALPPYVLPPTIDGKWVSGIDSGLENPLVVISKAKFLDQSVLNKLAEINRHSTWIIDKIWVQPGPFDVKYGVEGHLGWKNAQASDIAWSRVHPGSVPSETRDKVTGSGAWFGFTKSQTEKDEAGINVRIVQKATTTNYIFVQEGHAASGKVEIAAFGRTLVESNLQTAMLPYNGWVLNEWSTTIIFDGSKHGEPVKIISEDIVQGKTTAHCNRDEFDAKVNKPVEKQLERFKYDNEDLAKRLEDALQDDWPFLIPGRGDPYYVDRVFFVDGLDCVCQLKQREVESTGV